MAGEIKTSWSEADLNALIGQPESIRREFKSGVMFDRDPESKWVEALSKEVSALANTEGGELILGVDEDRKSKPRVAAAIDGVSTKLAPERLQQLIESNVSPYLPGMRVHRVKLSAFPDRVVFVIQVPHGSTAYQANDGRYYGRSEFEAKYLPDHEVRLRMMRGRLTQVRFEVTKCEILTAEEELAGRKKTLQWIASKEAEGKVGELVAINRGGGRAKLKAPRRTFDEISIRTELVNVGQVTIRDFLLSIACDPPLSLIGWVDHLQNRTLVEGSRTSEVRIGFLQTEVVSAAVGQTKMFPGERVCFPACALTVVLPEGAPERGESIPLQWTVYLDDAPPSSGVVELRNLIRGTERTVEQKK